MYSNGTRAEGEERAGMAEKSVRCYRMGADTGWIQKKSEGFRTVLLISNAWRGGVGRR